MNSDHEKFILGNYSSPVLEVSASHGSVLQDSEGKEYLDFTSGIAVTNLGHGHPHWVKQVSAQAKKIVHCSNLFSIPEQVRLAKRLVELTAPGKMLFCNSGAEANEGLIKFARLVAEQSSKKGKNRIIAAENAFLMLIDTFFEVVGMAGVIAAVGAMEKVSPEGHILFATTFLASLEIAPRLRSGIRTLS